MPPRRWWRLPGVHTGRTSGSGTCSLCRSPMTASSRDEFQRDLEGMRGCAPRGSPGASPGGSSGSDLGISLASWAYAVLRHGDRAVTADHVDASSIRAIPGGGVWSRRCWPTGFEIVERGTVEVVNELAGRCNGQSERWHGAGPSFPAVEAVGYDTFCEALTDAIAPLRSGLSASRSPQSSGGSWDGSPAPEACADRRACTGDSSTATPCSSAVGRQAVPRSQPAACPCGQPPSGPASEPQNRGRTELAVLPGEGHCRAPG